MKKTILMILSFAGAELYSRSTYLESGHEKKTIRCSFCGRALVDEDFLYGAASAKLKGYSLLDPKKTKVEVTVYKNSDDEDDGFEITVNNQKDRIWKRGAEVLIPDNGCLVLYNFRSETVERFDMEKASSLEIIERELPKLKFSEIK